MFIGEPSNFLFRIYYFNVLDEVELSTFYFYFLKNINNATIDNVLLHSSAVFA